MADIAPRGTYLCARRFSDTAETAVVGKVMSKFYFKVIDREGVLPPDEPYEFADVKEAMEQARLALTEMATDGLPNEPTNMLSIEVQDEDHKPLLEMRLILEILANR
jgi:hypothetical protein